MQHYEPPQLGKLGSLADITKGGDPDNLGDGAAYRGPAVADS